jgi:hypothetical protein
MEAAYGLIISMPPQQPVYPQQQPSDPYEFITSSGQQPKGSLLPSGNSMKQRILVVVGGGAVFLILIIIIANIVSGSGNNGTEKLVSIAQQQTEIVRIASIGMQQAQSQDSKNFATTADLSVLSAQQQMVDFLAQHGRKIKTKELVLKHSAQTDNQINAAVAASSFDETFKPIMQNQLQQYSLALKQLFPSIKNADTRQMISNDYDDAQALLEQLAKVNP